AELEDDEERRRSWLTFVVVGAGPTGVEMAGQIAELARDTLRHDFRAIDPREGRILLVEVADRVLTSFPPSLSRKAARSLAHLRVTPRLEGTGGPRAAAVARAGVFAPRPALTLPGHPEVLALGDMVRVRDKDGAPVVLPGV